MTSIEPWAIQI